MCVQCKVRMSKMLFNPSDNCMSGMKHYRCQNIIGLKKVFLLSHLYTLFFSYF